MVRVALTGGIACGKSLVGRFLHRRGVAVCDSDVIAHELMSRDACVTRQIAALFGRRMLCDTGAVDRRALALRVFADKQALVELNSITHPHIIKKWNEWLGQRKAGGDKIAVVIIPLLFEINNEKAWEHIICVASRHCDQVKRLRERGLSTPQITQRLVAQIPVQQKMNLSDFVLYNCSTVKALNDQTMRVWRAITEMHHG